VASLRLTSLTIANLTKATLTTVESGKIVKDVQVETTGKTPAVATTTTTTTTTTTAGISRLVISGDLSSTAFTNSEAELSIVGGRSINTAVESGELVINLNEAVNFTQAVVNSSNTISPLIIKNASNQVVFWINTQGVPVLEPKTTLPAVTSGIVYISGSVSTPEGYYVGFPEITTADAERTDITNI
jgi:hypothetical protein